MKNHQIAFLFLASLCHVSFVACPGAELQPAAAVPETDSSADYILGGKPDKGHPAVGALILEAGGLCTGTLVSPRAVLTAAHCVADMNPEYFVIGNDAFDGGTALGAVRALVHPQYSMHHENGEAVAWHDVAVVILAEDAPVEPMAVASEAPVEGDKVTFVGFGQNSTEGESCGLKFKLKTEVAQVWSHGFWNLSDPAHPKNTCFGDSGGPALLKRGNAEEVAGVVSSGDPACRENGYSIRVDVDRSFIEQAIASAGGDGTCGDGECGRGEDAGSCPEDCDETCDAIGYTGCCEGEVVVWCEAGKPEQLDCGPNPHCGWNANAAYYDCGTDGGGEPEGLGKSCAARLLE